MKIVFRADDVGYTHVHNLGTLEAIENGVVSDCECMFDWPDVVEMLQYLSDKPWISVGWHPHMWGHPVLDPSEVPSLVTPDGNFKWKRIDQCEHPVEGVVYEEMVKEFRAQMELCKKYLGRYPDIHYGDDRPGDDKQRAIMQVVKEYGIPYGFMNNERHGMVSKARPEYEHLNIWGTYEVPQEGLVTLPGHKSTLNVLNFLKYDPEKAILDLPIEDDKIIVKVLHPGYLDKTVLKEQSCNIHRVKDVEVFTSPKVKQWIIDNKVEIVNQYDAIFGTSRYQDHLKEINSPLWIGNM
ncbi:MAG: ChbG/HpnK family deacetylase [Erysipelotrichaceae bacterium]|nr:ChbG/HpnK family deacetylase [Erysipelotrichaceae bacterium]